MADKQRLMIQAALVGFAVLLVYGCAVFGLRQRPFWFLCGLIAALPRILHTMPLVAVKPPPVAAWSVQHRCACGKVSCMIAPPLLERPRNDSGPGSAPAASGGLRRALFVESYPHAMYGQQQEMLAMLKRWPRDRFNAMVATPADGPFVDAVRELGIEPIAARYCDVMICLKPSDVSFGASG